MKTVNKKDEIVTLAGTRPEIIKLTNFIKEMNKQKDANHSLLYTGQHYSTNMKDVFFDELGIQPDYDLGCNTSSVKELTKRILIFFKEKKPRYVIVYGDTYSTMAGSLAAKQLKIPLIHLEAGIRDLDITIPEEGVRIYVDAVSDFKLAPTELAKTFLFYEGVGNNVSVTGNLISDVCKEMVKICGKYRIPNLPKEYLLLTMHRPENVDSKEGLELLKKHLSTLKYKVVFPIHPRTVKNLSEFGINLPDNVIPINATGYLEFLCLLKNCNLVLTDSGGVTEEAIILKKPCITLRHSTARWETILLKANILFPLDRKDPLIDVINKMIETKIKINPYGENVTKKTVDKIRRITSAQ